MSLIEEPYYRKLSFLYPMFIVIATSLLTLITFSIWSTVWDALLGRKFYLITTSPYTYSAILDPSKVVFDATPSQVGSSIFQYVISIPVAAFLILFLIKYRKSFNLISYYLVGVMSIFFLFPAYLLSNDILFLVPLVILPIVFLFLYTRFNISYLYTYTAICFSAWLGSLLVVMINYNLAIICLLIFLVSYDLFAVFVGPLKQIVAKFKSTNSDMNKTFFRYMLVDIKVGHLGVADLVFYSVTISLASRIFHQVFYRVLDLGQIGVLVSLVLYSIIGGLYATIYLMKRYNTPLPALPLPIILSLTTILVIVFVV